MSGRLKKPMAPEPAPEIEESGSPDAAMEEARRTMMIVIKRSIILFFPSVRISLVTAGVGRHPGDGAGLQVLDEMSGVLLVSPDTRFEALL